MEIVKDMWFMEIVKGMWFMDYGRVEKCFVRRN